VVRSFSVHPVRRREGGLRNKKKAGMRKMKEGEKRRKDE